MTKTTSRSDETGTTTDATSPKPDTSRFKPRGNSIHIVPSRTSATSPDSYHSAGGIQPRSITPRHLRKGVAPPTFF